MTVKIELDGDQITHVLNAITDLMNGFDMPHGARTAIVMAWAKSEASCHDNPKLIRRAASEIYHAIERTEAPRLN
jgi:uncharacterized protein (UPF0147 family)